MLASQSRPVFRQTHHAIDEIGVELEFGSKALEMRERETLIDWLQDELLPALDEVFSFYAPGNQTIRFEELLFDFGRLPASDYRQIIREQLVHKITHLIKSKSLPLEFANQRLHLDLRGTESAPALKLLLDYLRTGQLHAQAFAVGNRNAEEPELPRKVHQQLLESLIAEQHIAEQLRALPNRDQWITRILKQFSERHRSALLQQLAIRQLPLALALIDALHISLPAKDDKSVMAMWRALLEVALDQPDTQAQQWFDHVIKKWLSDMKDEGWLFIQSLQTQPHASLSLANAGSTQDLRSLNTYADNFLRENHQAIQPLGHRNIALEPQYRISTDHNEDHPEYGNPDYSKPDDVNTYKLGDRESDEGLYKKPEKVERTFPPSENVRQRLARVLIRGDANEFIAQWNNWNTTHSGVLVSALKHYLINPELRQQFFLKLPPVFLGEVLAFLAPSLHNFISQVGVKAHLFADSLHKLADAPSYKDTMPVLRLMSAEDWLHQTYECIATQLFANLQRDTSERSTGLSASFLVDEVLESFSRRWDLSLDDLRVYWLPLFNSITTPASQVKQENLVSAKKELPTEYVKPARTDFAYLEKADVETVDSEVQASEVKASEIHSSEIHSLEIDSSEIMNSSEDESEIKDSVHRYAAALDSSVSPRSESSLLKKDKLSAVDEEVQIDLLIEKIRTLFVQQNVQEFESLWREKIATLRDKPDGLGIAKLLAGYWQKPSVRQVFLSTLSLSVLEHLLSFIAPAYQRWFSRNAAQRNILLQRARSTNVDNASDGNVSIGFDRLSSDEWLRGVYSATSERLWDLASQTDLIISSETIDVSRYVAHYFSAKYSVPEQPLYQLWNDETPFYRSNPSRVYTERLDEAESSHGNDSVSVSVSASVADDIPRTEVGNQPAPSGVDRPNEVHIPSLMEKSDQELFEWCLQLKDKAEVRNVLRLSEPLAGRMIDSFIKYSPKFSAEFRQYFLASVYDRAENISAKGDFFSRILFALIDDQLIDLEAIAASVGSAAPLNVSPVKKEQVNQRVVEQGTMTPSSDDATVPMPDVTVDAQLGDSGSASDLPMQQRLTQFIKDLRGQHIDPFGLRMGSFYWNRLIEQFIRASAMNEMQEALLTSIRSFAVDAIDPHYFYQQVVHALVNDIPLDLEVFVTQVSSSDSFPESERKISRLDSGNVQQQNLYADKNDRQVMVPHSPQSEKSTADEQKKINTLSTTWSPNATNKASAVGGVIDEASIAKTPSNNVVTEPPITTFAEQYLPETLTELSGSEDPLRSPESSLLELLQTTTGLTHEKMQQLQHHVNLLLQHFTQTRAQEWINVLRNPLCSQQLIQHVPGHLLHQIIQRLQPAAFSALDPIVKLATEALSLLMPRADPLLVKQARWEFVFSRIFGSSEPLDSANVLKRCCEKLADTLNYPDSQRLIQLAERRLVLLKPVAPVRASMSLDSSENQTEPVVNFEAGIHLNNVGMVLASPFLPRLFSMFNLLEDGKFIHSGAADRAAHLLQYMVTGESETAEYELVLNKILCGISTSMPISAGIDVSDQEKMVIEQMLQSMIQHWRALGSTSVTGLRETFFQRQGWLVLDDEYWRLKVQERTFDMLLDRLPWSISMIKHAWMDKPLRVSWREQS